MKNLTIVDGIKFLKEKPDTVILDVRTEKEFKKGHMKNAINISIYELKDRIKELYEYREKNILVHCSSGRRSPVAIMILEDNGFENLFHLYKGIIAFWEVSGKDLIAV